MNRTKLISLVTNDLVTDQRVFKSCNTLLNLGFDVTCLGRKLAHSKQVDGRNYTVKRLSLFFTKGFLFYVEINLRFFLYLISHKVDIILANDLDTLLAATVAGKFKGVPVIYDSHEYFTQVPELIDRPRIQRVWEKIESICVPLTSDRYTVSGSIANIYQQKYSLPFKVVRNFPNRTQFVEEKNRLHFPGKKIVLYQGAVNIGRGIKETILSMQFINDNVVLVIIGIGDTYHEMKELSTSLGMNEKVFFLGQIPFQELYSYTKSADLGLCLLEDMGMNYFLTIPNRIGDYPQARIPILATAFPEVKALLEEYETGMLIDTLNPKEIAAAIDKACFDKALRAKWMIEIEQASEKWIWEEEEKVIETIFSPFLHI